jgi:hypothetical protein
MCFSWHRIYAVSVFLFLFSVLNSDIILADTAMLAGNVEDYNGSRVDSHAPISVMAEHYHEKGEWMLSYRYMQMRMSGSRIGHNNVSNTEVLKRFMVTPTDMTTQMHMLGFMVAPSDRVTLMATLPIIRKNMDHRTRAGVTFQTHSDGIGDVKLAALIPVFEKKTQRVHLNAGLSIPVGETDEHGDLPAGPNQRLPYPMQLGSGTWDLLPGVTYSGQTENWSWGAQALSTIRPGRNRIGYSLGNVYEMTFWGQRKWTTWLSNGAGLRHKIWENINGRDPGLNPQMVPTADPKSRGGKRIDFLFGLNLYMPKGILKGQRLAFEVGFPVMQSLDGPQLETDWYLMSGWQASFG